MEVVYCGNYSNFVKCDTLDKNTSYLYLVELSKNLIKIGHSSNIKERIKAHKHLLYCYSGGKKIGAIAIFKCNNLSIIKVEQEILTSLKTFQKSLGSEFFLFSFGKAYRHIKSTLILLDSEEDDIKIDQVSYKINKILLKLAARNVIKGKNYIRNFIKYKELIKFINIKIPTELLKKALFIINKDKIKFVLDEEKSIINIYWCNVKLNFTPEQQKKIRQDEQDRIALKNIKKELKR